MKPHSRQIGHGKRRVTVEMVGFNEPLEQIPTHHRRFIGARRGEGGRTGCSTLKDAVASNGSMGRDRVQRRELAAGADLELWNCGASSPDTCPVTLTPRHPELLQTHPCCLLRLACITTPACITPNFAHFYPRNLPAYESSNTLRHAYMDS